MNSIQTQEDNNLHPAKNQQQANPDSINIAYKQTRIHSPNQQLLKENRIISALLPGKWLESYRMLRTRCLQSMDAMELDRTALLVDANFQNPSVNKLFGIQSDIGLSDYLLHDTEISSMLINPGIDRLVILPAGKPLFNSTEMLRSPKMVRLVNELRSRYPSRIIIFDMPPILSHDDTLGFSPYVDCVLLVIEEGRTKSDELKHTVDLLKDINVLGTVFNKSTDNKIPFDN